MLGLASCQCHQLVGRHGEFGAAAQARKHALGRAVQRFDKDATVFCQFEV
jgi:hypothetical protein